MSHFENTTEMYPSLGGQKAAEEIAEVRRQEAERKERADALLAEEKARQDKEKKVADDRAVLRAEEINEEKVVAAIMESNPNFSKYEARRLYEEKVRSLVAIRRFEDAFFGQPAGAKSLLGVSRM